MSLSKTGMEKKWGIKVVTDFTKGRSHYYKIYSADGCLWENGLRGMIAVEAECKKWNDALLEIKAKAEEVKL